MKNISLSLRFLIKVWNDICKPNNVVFAAKIFPFSYPQFSFSRIFIWIYNLNETCFETILLICFFVVLFFEKKMFLNKTCCSTEYRVDQGFSLQKYMLSHFAKTNKLTTKTKYFYNRSPNLMNKDVCNKQLRKNTN